MIPVVLAVSYLAARQINGNTAKWQARVPPIPTAFTGREKEIQLLVDFISKKHVSIVSITGGPAYGKSSLAIVGSRRLMPLGIQVYYVSLSEANSMETFIMTFMHSTALKSTEEVPRKKELLIWVSSIKANTVIVLDNADHLTLNEKLRNRFLILLKDVVAASEHVHLVVTTRYRFKIADGFEEIHVQPLEPHQAVTLLKDLILAAKGEDQDESVDFEVIVNKTGGIPLAIKVVGRLLNSQALSGAEIIGELSSNPLRTLSRESFTPDEQLRLCFDLSFKYLKPHEQQCFHYASRFPGSFDHKAGDAIITATTGDANCLEHLVDRSLLEYSYLAKRYIMHSLLRAFAKDSASQKYRKRRYFLIFVKHYMDRLSNCIIEARTGGNVSIVYTTIAEDYHNFLHVLQLYVNGTVDHLVSQADVLAFALDTFDIMQPRFPQEALVEWWTKILNSTCKTARQDLNSFERLVPQFLKLSTKFGKLLLHYNKTLLAKRILRFANQCVRSVMQPWIDQCSYPHHSLYNAMLQVLKSVYEKDGEIHRALNLRTQIYSCIKLQSWNDPDSTMPEDVCSDGISYLKQQVTRDSGDFWSAVLLFDVLYKCNVLPADGVMLQRLESTFYKHQFDTRHARIKLKAIVAVAKRFHLVLDYEKEVQWLTMATQFVEGIPLFNLHFLLTRLYWHVLDNQEEALKHGKIAYDLAMHGKDQVGYSRHGIVFKAAVRLADILHQIDDRHMDAGQYFQEALDRLPFINADAGFIFQYQEFIVSHLMSIYYQSNQYVLLFKHYGQWAELEMSRTILNVRMLLELPYHPPISHSTSLAETDDSLDHIFGIRGTARQFLNVCVKRVHDATFFYLTSLSIFFVLCIFTSVLLVVACFLCIPVYCTTVTILTLLFTLVRYSVLLPLYCIHHFLFHTITTHKLWVPHHIPVVPRPIISVFWVIYIIVLLYTTVIVWVLCFSGLYLWLMHSHFVTSPDEEYHNMTMNIRDSYIYD